MVLQIIQDTGKSSTTYTRIRAPFINTGNFYFKIYTVGLFSDIAKMLGTQDIVIGSKEFYFRVIGVIKDIQRLKELFQMFGEVLNELCNIGSANSSKPDFQL